MHIILVKLELSLLLGLNKLNINKSFLIVELKMVKLQ